MKTTKLLSMTSVSFHQQFAYEDLNSFDRTHFSSDLFEPDLNEEDFFDSQQYYQATQNRQREVSDAIIFQFDPRGRERHFHVPSGYVVTDVFYTYGW